VTLVLRGAFEERFGHRPLECQRNGLLIKPPGEAHTNRYSRDGARSLLIHVPVSALVRFGKAARVYDSVRYFAYGAANRLAICAAREIGEGDDAGALAAEGLLLEMLAAVLRRSYPHANARDAWLRRAIDFLHAHFRTPMRLVELGSVAGVSPTRVARAFRRVLGETPGAYQRRLRLEWARDELMRTDQRLAQIAIAAGFADQSHFTRDFVRALGVTPAAFRRRAGRENS
jgi:AraC-like DNA-binding protein